MRITLHSTWCLHCKSKDASLQHVCSYIYIYIHSFGFHLVFWNIEPPMFFPTLWLVWHEFASKKTTHYSQRRRIWPPHRRVDLLVQTDLNEFLGSQEGVQESEFLVLAFDMVLTFFVFGSFSLKCVLFFVFNMASSIFCFHLRWISWSTLRISMSF